MADIKFVKATVTNTSGGPKVLNAKDIRVLQAGETAEDVEISEAELEAAKGTEWFGFGKAAAKAADPLDHDGDGRKGGAAPAKG